MGSNYTGMEFRRVMKEIADAAMAAGGSAAVARRGAEQRMAALRQQLGVAELRRQMEEVRAERAAAEKSYEEDGKCHGAAEKCYGVEEETKYITEDQSFKVQKESYDAEEKCYEAEGQSSAFENKRYTAEDNQCEAEKNEYMAEESCGGETCCEAEEDEELDWSEDDVDFYEGAWFPVCDTTSIGAEEKGDTAEEKKYWVEGKRCQVEETGYETAANYELENMDDWTEQKDCELLEKRFEAEEEKYEAKGQRGKPSYAALGPSVVKDTGEATGNLNLCAKNLAKDTDDSNLREVFESFGITALVASPSKTSCGPWCFTRIQGTDVEIRTGTATTDNLMGLGCGKSPTLKEECLD